MPWLERMNSPEPEPTVTKQVLVLVLVQVAGPNSSIGVVVLRNATVTTGVPPVPTPCVKVKLPVSVWPAIVIVAGSTVTSTDSGFSEKLTVTVPLSETPGTSSAIVPVKLPDAPLESSVTLPLPPVTDTTPPASDSDTPDSVRVVVPDAVVSVTLPEIVWPAIVTDALVPAICT